MRLAKKRHKAWLAATAPARKAARSVHAMPSYDQAEVVRIVEERLAALKPPPEDNRRRGKVLRSATLHAAMRDLFIEFLECLGFEADDKGHAVRKVNGVVQTIGVGAMRHRFRAHIELSFKSSATRKMVQLVWVCVDHLGPHQPSFFPLNEVGFEHSVMHCFVGVLRYGLPLLQKFQALPALLTDRRPRGMFLVGEWPYNLALAHAEVGDYARAKGEMRKLIDGVATARREVRAKAKRLYEEALRGIEKLEKSGRPLPAVAKAPAPPPTPSATPAEVLARIERSWPAERLKAAAKMDEDRRARELGDLFEELAATHLVPLGFAAAGGEHERIVGEIRQEIGFQFLQGHFAFTVGLGVVEPPLELLGMRQDGLDGDPIEFRSTAPSAIVRQWKETVRKLFAYTIPLFDQCDSLETVWSLHEAGKLPLRADLLEPESFRAALVCERLGDMERTLALLEQARREKPGSSRVQAKLKELRRARK